MSTLFVFCFSEVGQSDVSFAVASDDLDTARSRAHQAMGLRLVERFQATGETETGVIQVEILEFESATLPSDYLERFLNNVEVETAVALINDQGLGNAAPVGRA